MYISIVNKAKVGLTQLYTQRIYVHIWVLLPNNVALPLPPAFDGICEFMHYCNPFKLGSFDAQMLCTENL